MKDKVILICIFISISLVVLSTGKASWQDPLQVSGSIITGSWKEPEQIEPAGEPESGAPVEGLPGGEAEDPEAGAGLDTSTPSEPVGNGSVVGETGDGANNSGNGEGTGGVEDEAEAEEITGGSETESSPTDAGQEFVADDGGAASPNAPEMPGSDGISEARALPETPNAPNDPDISETQEKTDSPGDENDEDDDTSVVEADTSNDDTVAGDGADAADDGTGTNDSADANDGADDAADDDTGAVAD